MNIVEPIRSRDQIRRIKGNLLRQKNPRDLLLFTMGINSGLRISDLLPLKLKDVIDGEGAIRDFIYLVERKTKKPRKIAFNKATKQALQIYFDKSKVYDLDRFLFTSERGNKNKPLTKVRAWQLINSWCRVVGIKVRVGTHTLRKTFGYQMRMQGVPVERISRMLGHNNTKVTFRYLGIDDDEMEKDINNFNL